jgi:hypothetical protein
MKLKAELDTQLTERFLVVKEHTGMKNDKNVLAFLISKEYRKIQASRYRYVFVANATYDAVEKKATAQGQSVEIFVQELIDAEIKKSEEGEKHAEN